MQKLTPHFFNSPRTRRDHHKSSKERKFPITKSTNQENNDTNRYYNFQYKFNCISYTHVTFNYLTFVCKNFHNTLKTIFFTHKKGTTT